MQDNLLQDGTERAPKDHDRTPGVVQIASETDFTPGPVSNTGNPLDVALGRANQFFVVSTPEGERLTRAGNFTKNANGTLVTPDGLSVQGDGGEIVLPAGEASISSNGAILVGKQVVGRLRVVEVNDLTQLRRTEGARFKSEGGTGEPVENPELITNSVEMPNISVVEAMVEMINAQKAFEAYTKSVRTIDELNERSIRNARLSG
jgi:flagellar basal body rod protein FlgG